MKVALIGTRGVPARYGGFETAVEELGAGLADRGHEVVVYCRGASDVGPTYRGMRRVLLPALRLRAWETITHTALSILHVLRERPAAVIVFNAANAPFLLALRLFGVPVALHLDGHDARRRKWQGVGRHYYGLATRLGIRLADEVIVDSAAVQADLVEQYGSTSVCLSYGAATTVTDPEDAGPLLARVGLERGSYHLLVARFEPENHVLEIVRSYLDSECTLPLVLVGFSGFPSGYDSQIAELVDPRLLRLGAVWDQALLDALYAGCRSYVHGHSVGGTNPSLLRAMVNAAPVIAYDCSYNRETTGGAALWFAAAQEAGALMSKVELDGLAGSLLGERSRERARRHYRWPDVVAAYETLLLGLRERPALTRRQSGA